MTVHLDRMARESRDQLREDVQSHGDLVGRLTIAQLSDILGSQKRAERLSKWVRTHGLELPGGDETSTTGRLPRILMVGDTHAKADEDQSHFFWLGQLARELLTEPEDVLWLAGDHYCMDGLFWKRTAGDMEGKRYRTEKWAGDHARMLIMEGLGDCPARKIVSEGNHCYRVKDWLSKNPYFDGCLDLWYDWPEDGWEVVPFPEYIRVHGFRLQHHFTGRSGRPVSSVAGNARAVLEKVVRFQESVAFGHTHEKDVWYAGGITKTVMAINVGRYARGHEGYESPDDNARWWDGAILVRDIVDGVGDIQEYRMDTIERMYG